MNSLFGVELGTPATFVIAFVIVLALIGAAAWLVRRFGAARLAAGRGRQPRLAVIDAAAVDGRRKLIIIRRDNVEHLLMIGGPSDVVVETNILRAGAANQREAPQPRANVESLPRAVTLPDAASWPLQPEPAAAPRAERPRSTPEEPQVSLTVPPPPIAVPLRASPEPTSRTPVVPDPLMGLAAELSRTKPDTTVRPPEPPRIPMAAQYPGAETPAAPTPQVATPSAGAPDVHLAEMAHRLETALRRPLSQTAKPDAQRPPAAPVRAETRPSQTNGAPANGSSANGAQGKTVYESLEQEMASLLGRQSGKT